MKSKGALATGLTFKLSDTQEHAEERPFNFKSPACLFVPLAHRVWTQQILYDCVSVEQKCSQGHRYTLNDLLSYKLHAPVENSKPVSIWNRCADHIHLAG